MDPENAIEVKNVSKKFHIRRKATTLKDLLSYRDKREKSPSKQVLDDISFSVKKGEALGIIGKNGSGKSTTLKLLSKILRPESGTIEIDGKVACLIELGAGFHPDMTGRENIYINASIFGLDTKSVNRKIDEIIEFSGISEYIDQRVRNYSSGMYMRLAFSIATSVEADVLLIDEILAVGDIEFQKKCFDRLMQFKKNGGTIILVTQSPDQAKGFCDRVMWIDNGHIREYGEAEKVCDDYVNAMIHD